MVEEENVDLYSEDIFGISFEDPDLSSNIKDLRDNENIVYPCILLNGIEYTNVLSLICASDKGSCRSLDTWIYMEDEYHQINPIALTFNTLILMRNLGVIVTIYASYDKVTTLNLNDPKVLEKYI